MDEEQLKKIVEMVTQEVLRIRNGGRSADNNEAKSKVLVVFTSGSANNDMVKEQMQKIGEKYHILGLFSPAAKRVLGEDWMKPLIDREIFEKELHAVMGSVETVIFPTLTQNTAAKAAYGIRDSLASEAFACALMTGKRVLATTDCVLPGDLPVPYRTLCSVILKRLKALGVCLCSVKEIFGQIVEPLSAEHPGSSTPLDLEMALKSPSPLEPEQRPDTKPETESVMEETLEDLRERKLLDAQSIEATAGREVNRILISPSALITPMARDIAMEMNIEIMRSDA